MLYDYSVELSGEIHLYKMLKLAILYTCSIKALWSMLGIGTKHPVSGLWMPPCPTPAPQLFSSADSYCYYCCCVHHITFYTRSTIWIPLHYVLNSHKECLLCLQAWIYTGSHKNDAQRCSFTRTCLISFHFLNNWKWSIVSIVYSSTPIHSH